jgi:hypothetical protein
LNSSLFFLGFLASFVFELPWTFLIFKKAHVIWHSN